MFRPFWSYDVIKTENWLNQMSKNGFCLVNVNFLTRNFVFEKCESKTEYYRIVFQKKLNENIPQEIIDEGFTAIVADKNYYIVKTTDFHSKNMPSYIGIKKRNKTIRFSAGISIIILLALTFTPAIFLIGYFLYALAIITAGLIYGESPKGKVLPPNAFETITFFIFVAFGLIYIITMLWLLYTFFKLRSSNKKL